MVLFPNVKINLGLHVIRKRSDGYHDIETVFYPLAFYDIIEAISSPGSERSFQFTNSGLSLPIDRTNNLCVKAYELLKKDFPDLPAVHFHLHKLIPAGAGLGGGSADAAFTLVLLNKKFNLGLGTEKLLDYALRLGSDCPFFIINQPCIATGRGEFLQKIQCDLSNWNFIIVNPGIHVDTASAFSKITPEKSGLSLKELIKEPVGSWKGLITNDFEEPVFAMHPEIKNIKEQLYAAGAVYASMTGSGSSVYGMFEKDKPPTLKLPRNYFVKTAGSITGVPH
jgi:4-diphosphocytidyl-2-C-methyl-D-erythritol kinase